MKSSPKPVRASVIVLALVVSVGLAAYWLLPLRSERGAMPVGAVAPDLALLTSTGASWTRAGSGAGPTVLVFYRGWW